MRRNVAVGVPGSAAPRIVTAEGGAAQRVSPLAQLERSVMSCLLWEDGFYEDGDAIEKRIADLVAQVDPAEVAALAIRAREEMYLRHVPLRLVRELARRKGEVRFLQPVGSRPPEPVYGSRSMGTVVADVLERIIQRPDEITEMLALYYGDRAPNAPKEPLAAGVRRGLARAFRKFDAYQLAKYDRPQQYRLRDAVRLAHPQRTDVVRALLDGKLPAPDTWEVALSTGKAPKETWERLLEEKKLGGLALLRNLRNMEKAGVDRARIREALEATRFKRVLPFRFLTAARICPWAEEWLDAALVRTMSEGRPFLQGVTLALVDVSGSMFTPLSKRRDGKPSLAQRIDAACALAIYLREVSESGGTFTFSHRLEAVPPRRGMALRDAIVNSQPHGGTYLGAAVKVLGENEPLRKNVHRLVVFTDEQSGDALPACPFARGYVVNVAAEKNGLGYGNGWRHVDGWTEHVVRYIAALEASETGVTPTNLAEALAPDEPEGDGAEA